MISFPSLMGQVYRVERTESLCPASWAAVAENVPGTGDTITIADPGRSLQIQGYYRVILLPP